MNNAASQAASKLRATIRRRRNDKTITIDRGSSIESRRKRQTLVRSKGDAQQSRLGLYLYGACDLPSLLELGPLLANEPSLTTAISSEGHIFTTRADFILQTLDELPTEFCDEVTQRLELQQGCFEPKLFEPTFTVPRLDPEPFPKSVIFLSLGSNVVRTLYQHNDTGVLVDPGGWWLGNGSTKVSDQETLDWFRSNFKSTGRLTPEQWQPLFARVIEELQSRMNTRIVVLNLLTVEPGSHIHNYGVRRHPEGARRRGFQIALSDLARQLHFPIIDIDRLLKRDGVGEQIDFAHFPVERFETIASESFEILQELGLFDRLKTQH